MTEEDRIQRWVGDMYDIMTVHPSGAIMARRAQNEVRLFPRRDTEGRVKSWKLVKTIDNGGKDIDFIPSGRVDLLKTTIQDWTG